MVEWPSGQWQQTVNLPSYEFVGSNPTSTTNSFTTRPQGRVLVCEKPQFPRGFQISRVLLERVQSAFSLSIFSISLAL